MANTNVLSVTPCIGCTYQVPGKVLVFPPFRGRIWRRRVAAAANVGASFRIVITPRKFTTTALTVIAAGKSWRFYFCFRGFPPSSSCSPLPPPPPPPLPPLPPPPCSSPSSAPFFVLLLLMLLLLLLRLWIDCRDLLWRSRVCSYACMVYCLSLSCMCCMCQTESYHGVVLVGTVVVYHTKV